MRYTTLVPGVLAIAALLVAGCGGSETTTTTTNIMPIQVAIQTQTLPGATVGQAYSVQIVASGGTGTFNWMIESGGTNDGWLLLDDQGVLSGSPGPTNAGAVTVIIKASEEGNDNNFDLQAFAFNVQAVVTGFGISTASLPNAWTGQFYSRALEAYGASGDYVWRKLLGGVNDSWINVSTGGTVSGTPPVGAVGPVTLHVKLSDAQDPATYTTSTFDFNVYSGSLNIDNADPLPNAAAGQAYSVVLRPRGGSGSYIWGKEAGGVNNAWLGLDAAGTLTGTAPTALGVVAVNISVMDAQNPNLFFQKTFHFQVKLLAISTEKLADAYVAQNYSQALTAQGGTGSVTWSIEPGGANYAWMQISGSNIQSTVAPTANEIGNVSVIVKATDGTNTDARLYHLNVWDTLQIASTTMPDAFALVSYSENVLVMGGSGNFVYSIQSGGSNNSWLSLDTATGRLYGLPTSANVGVATLVVRAQEAENSAVYDQQTLTINVLGLQITTGVLPTASVGQAYAVQLQVQGGSGYTAWSITAGPTWLVIDPNTGALSGTPTAAGITTVTISVYDPMDPLLNDTKNFSLIVVNTLLIEDFEGGASGWIFNSYWYRYVRDHDHTTYRERIGPKDAHSGTYVAQNCTTSQPYGYASWNTSYYLQSPSITVPATGNCYLTYWQWYQFEDGYQGTADGGRLMYDLNGNNLWMPLTPTHPNGYPGTAGGQSAFTGYGVSPYNEGWTQVVFDLSALAGNSVRIRWDSYGDSDGWTFRGWFVDDVHVFDLGGTATAPMAVSTPIPGDGWTYGVGQATDFTNGVNLTWAGSAGATSYDVYVGGSSSAVGNATTSSSEFMGNQTALTYSATSLTAGSTTFWRVDARNATGATAGPVWTFTPVNPVKVFVNETNHYYPAYYSRSIELFNPSTTVHQDLSRYILNSYGVYTTGWPYQTSFILPANFVLAPDEAISVTDYQTYYNYNDPWLTYRFMNSPVYYNLYYGYYQWECWLQDPSGVGVDYFGVNISTSNRPSDLNWNGNLTSSTSTISLWVRRNRTDTDSSSDWRGPFYYYEYGDSYGYGIYQGAKDQGQ